MADTRKRLLGEYLVLQAQAGDRRAFEQLVRLWQGDLLRHARRLSDDAEQAGDIMQEAWLDIVRGLNRLQAPAGTNHGTFTSIGTYVEPDRVECA